MSRPKSLNDFAPAGWWAIANTLVDGGASAPLPALVAALQGDVVPGELLRANAWLGDDGEDPAIGAQLLTERMVAELEEAAVVRRDGDTVRFTDEYLRAHSLPGGGVRLIQPGGRWTTYDALPADVRGDRRKADSDRANVGAAVLHASKYQREVKTPEQREGKHKVAKKAAEELFESLRAFGYLPAFPVVINAAGRVTEGNHRLAFAELARRSLVEERAQVAANGSEPLVLADLDRRIASLERAEILDHAVHPDGRAADDVKVIVASQIKIPWLAHERQHLARRLLLDGYGIAEIAGMLEASERSVLEWTQEDRESTAAEREAAQNAEIERLADLGWSTRQIAKRVGLGQSTVDRRLKEVTRERESAEVGQSATEPSKRVSQQRLTDEELDAAATESVERGELTRPFKDRMRAEGRGGNAQRYERAHKRAREQHQAEQDRERVLGAPPEPEPAPQPCTHCHGSGLEPS